MPEINYRHHFKVKLGELNKEKAALDKEIEKIGAILGALDEADMTAQRTLFSPSEDRADSARQSSENGLATKDAVINCLRSSGRKMRTVAVVENLRRNRKIARQTVNYTLRKLQKGNVVFRDNGKFWGLVGQDYAKNRTTST